MIYRPRKGARLTDEQAQRYGLAIADLIGEGHTRPEDVLQRAKDPRSDLHDYFDWDDSSAAKKYRRGQAGYLLRAIVVVIEDPEDEGECEHLARFTIPVKVVCEDADAEPEGEVVFVTTKRAMSEPSLRAQVVENALNAFISARARYKDIQELAGLYAAMDPEIEAVQKQLLLLSG